MWNLDRRRWEKGASACEMETFIFLFCWSANVLKGKEKAGWEKLILKKRNHFIPEHTAKPISPLRLVQLAIQGCCLLHSSPRIWKTDLICLWLHFSAPRCCFSRGILHFRQSMQFSSCIICEEGTCAIMDNVFDSLYLLLLLSRQGVSEENDSWKRLLFRFALSMETGPQLGLGGQQAAFTRLLLCPGLLQQDGLCRKDTLVSCALICCPSPPEHSAQVRSWRKGLIQSGK